MHRAALTPWWGALLSAVGLANLIVLVLVGEGWIAGDPLAYVPTVVGQVAVAGLLLLGPWVAMTATRLGGEPDVRPVLRRVTAAAAALTTVGVGFAVGAAVGGTSTGDPAAAADTAGTVGTMTIAIAFLLAFGGLVMGPWILLLTHRVTRERAARVRAEERAGVAAHLHDSVLQALTLIQKQATDPGATVRLARQTERELRDWLYGTAAGDDDLAGALRTTVTDVEDRFGITVELVLVGTCPLDERGRAVAGAVREALTNAAKHAGVRQVSVFAEIGESELLVIVRDRGRGFDQTSIGTGGRGIAGSVTGRMRGRGGTATIRTAPGEGTEVELRMPRGRTS